MSTTGQQHRCRRSIYRRSVTLPLTCPARSSAMSLIGDMKAGRGMTDPEAIERSRVAAAQIREQHQASQRAWNLGIMLVILTLGLAYALSGSRSGSGSSLSDVQYKVAAKQLIKQRLRDPGSAEFSSLEVIRVPGRPTVICGLVSSRNGFGGMSGPQRFISGDQVLVEETLPPGQMDREWARLC